MYNRLGDDDVDATVGGKYTTPITGMPPLPTPHHGRRTQVAEDTMKETAMSIVVNYRLILTTVPINTTDDNVVMGGGLNNTTWEWYRVKVSKC